MTGFLCGSELGKVLRSIGTEGGASIAIPLWHSSLLDQLTLPDNMSNFRIICDLSSGVCCLNTIREMLKRKANIVTLSGSHSSVLITRNSVLAASTNPFVEHENTQSEQVPTLAAGIYTDCVDDVAKAKKWFDALFAKGVVVTDDSLLPFEKRWRWWRSHRYSDYSLVDAILNNRPNIQDRDVKAYFFNADDPSDDLVNSYQSSKKNDEAGHQENDIDHCYWGEMPPSIKQGDHLLSFRLDAGEAECEGVWKLLKRRVLENGIVWETERVLDSFYHNLGDLEKLDRRVKNAVAVGKIEVNEEPISLTRLASILT